MHPRQTFKYYSKINILFNLLFKHGIIRFKNENKNVYFAAVYIS